MKSIWGMLREMPVDMARDLLALHLKEQDWKSIYVSRDVVGCSLSDAADILKVEVAKVKKYRRQAYEKLEYWFYPEKRKPPGQE